MASVYIATLAHSENGPFGSKVAFGRAVEEAFVQVYGQGMVLRWASCEELRYQPRFFANTFVLCQPRAIHF